MMNTVGFGEEPVLYRANGKTYGRVSNGRKLLDEHATKKATRDAVVALCVVSALSLALATTSVVLSVVVTRSTSVVKPEQQRIMSVCLPCQEVGGSTPKENELESLERLFQSRRNKWNDGSRREEEQIEEEEEMCCADDSNQLATLLNQILDEKTEKADDADDINERRAGDVSYPPCDLTSLSSANGTACLLPASLSLNPTTVAAHLVSSRSSSSASATSSAGSSGSETLSRWNLHSRRSFCRGLNCNATHLLPSHPGIYFIYSQVSFAVRSTVDPDESFTHSIKRFNTRYPNGGIDLLMRHSSTIRGNTPQSPSASSSSSLSTTDSSFLGGLARVYPNDQIYVEVTHSNLLRTSQTETFFGIFRL